MSDAPAFSNPLADALRRLPPAIFAVLEGAHFDDAPAELAQRGLRGRPLYLEGESDADVASGPHLVEIANFHVYEQLCKMAGETPALVFWSWPDGADTLYRHLRTINLVEIPNEDGTSVYETVVFRHADPNVMASILPLLDAHQMARLLGRAAGLAMNAPDFGGVKLMPRPDGLPEMPRGYLRIEEEQVDALEAVELAKSRSRVLRFLQETAPDEAAELGDADLRDTVLRAETEGEKLGLRSEHSYFLWSYLYLTTGGEIAQEPEVRKAFSPASTSDPDQMIEQIFDAHVEALDDPRLGGF